VLHFYATPKANKLDHTLKVRATIALIKLHNLIEPSISNLVRFFPWPTPEDMFFERSDSSEVSLCSPRKEVSVASVLSKKDKTFVDQWRLFTSATDPLTIETHLVALIYIYIYIYIYMYNVAIVLYHCGLYVAAAYSSADERSQQERVSSCPLPISLPSPMDQRESTLHVLLF
jgi:hypothetical protein